MSAQFIEADLVCERCNAGITRHAKGVEFAETVAEIAEWTRQHLHTAEWATEVFEGGPQVVMPAPVGAQGTIRIGDAA